MRYEIVRLWTLRSSRVAASLSVCLAALGGLSCGVQFREVPSSNGQVLASNFFLGAELTAIPWTCFALALPAVFAATDDFRTSQGAATYLTTPNRARALSAKLAVCWGFVAAAGLASMLVGFAIAWAVARSLEPLFTREMIVGVAVGHQLVAMFWAATALALGVLLRSTAPVVAGLIVVPLLMEVVIAGVLVNLGVSARVRHVLPFHAAVDLLHPAEVSVALSAVTTLVVTSTVLLFVAARRLRTRNL